MSIIGKSGQKIAFYRKQGYSEWGESVKMISQEEINFSEVSVMVDLMLDKVMPQNTEAERAVLSAMFFDR